MGSGRMVNHLVDAIRRAVADRNWYAALSLALTLPDICARIETPEEPSSRRFPRWWSENLVEKYTVREKVFLHAEDAYALRCAFLHEGRSDIMEQRARKAASGFEILDTPDGWTIHNNLHGDIVQLQIDIFCNDVCDAADRWLGRLSDEVDYPPLLEVKTFSY